MSLLPASELAAEFQEYKRRRGMNSTAEAVRSLVRDGLEQDQRTVSSEQQTDDGADDGRAAEPETAISSGQIEVDLLGNNKALLIAIAFALAMDSIRQTLFALAGDAIGSILFAVLGGIVILSLMPMLYRNLEAVLQSLTADDPDPQPDSSGADA